MDDFLLAAVAHAPLGESLQGPSEGNPGKSYGKIIADHTGPHREPVCWLVLAISGVQILLEICVAKVYALLISATPLGRITSYNLHASALIFSTGQVL